MIITLDKRIMRIGIFYKEKNKPVADIILKYISDYGFEYDNVKPDVVFSVGGDGTFLRTIHAYIDQVDHVQFVGVNSGSLGFLYDFSKEDIPVIFEMLKHNSCSAKQHGLLKGVATYRYGVEEIYAVNEIRIENPFRTLISKVLINDEELETFRGNGLIVSSPLGSSAYNKSLGGAFIDHDLEVLELTEVAGVSNRVNRSLNSSVVLSGDKKISFVGEMNKAVLGYDHLVINNDDELLSVEISYSDKKVSLICNEKESYVQKIRKSFVL